PLVDDHLVAHLRLDAAGRDVNARRRDGLQVFLRHVAWTERAGVDVLPGPIGDLDAVGGRPAVHLLERGVVDPDAQFAREDLVDRKELLQPSDVRAEGFRARGERVGREPDRDALRELALDLGQHDVVEPAEALLVGADDVYGRRRRAGLRELL